MQKALNLTPYSAINRYVYESFVFSEIYDKIMYKLVKALSHDGEMMYD